jgi:AmmeMemoRadiSam system protein A
VTTQPIPTRGASARTAADVPVPALGTDARAVALELARAAIEASVLGERLDVRPGTLPADLARPAGAFVTITRDGRLRSCMGRIDADRPFWENLLDAARSAAGHDPRFAPVGPDELPLVRIEVSALGPIVPIPDASAYDAATHGIVVERGRARALLLPQVARDLGWDETAMLDAVCEKAGLPARAWTRGDVRLSVFAAVVLDEPGAARDPDQG